MGKHTITQQECVTTIGGFHVVCRGDLPPDAYFAYIQDAEWYVAMRETGIDDPARFVAAARELAASCRRESFAECDFDDDALSAFRAADKQD